MELTSDQMDIFNGLMLSDAHLSKIKNNNCRSRITFSVKHREFVEKIKELLPLNWADIKESDVFDKRTGKFYHRCLLESRVGDFLTEQRIKWYFDSKKIVPKNICVTPLVLMWWYLGDGSLCRKKSRPNYRRICLSTNSFTEEENTFLIKKLKYLLDNDNIYLENNKIMLSRGSITRFSKIVGVTSPVKKYQYKFDFGQYLDENYFSNSYSGRPIEYINIYRKEHKVRELNYKQIREEMKNG